MKLEVLSEKSGDVETIVLNKQCCEEIFDQGNVADDELDMINMLNMLKDKYDVSGRVYHEFATVCKQLPRH